MHRTDKINGYINLENDPVWSCMHVWEDNIKIDINETGCGNLFIYLLQLGCYPVAVVILHVNKT